jgi:fatty acid desaturase
MNEFYRRDYDALARSRSRWVQDVATCGWAWTVTALAATHYIAWSTLGQAYAIFLSWIVLNQVRTLVAHGYANGTTRAISYVDQVLDTNTFPRGRLLPNLWAPLGLRYHALHHLIPSLPYHAMGEAHRRLMQRLPPDSPYHRTIKPGLWQALSTTGRDPHGTPPREREPSVDTRGDRQAYRR